MARICAQCGKKAVRANHVSHSNVKVPRRQKPNLQTAMVNGQKLLLCPSCRRALSK